MLYYQYILNWKDYGKKSRRSSGEPFSRSYRNEFETKYTDDTVNSINSNSRVEYQKDGKYLMFVTKVTAIKVMISKKERNDTTYQS